MSTERDFFIAQMINNGEDPDSVECKAFLARQENKTPYLRLVVDGNVNHYPSIKLPTIPSAKLAAHRAANEIFGGNTSHAEDLEAGFIPRPASKGDLTLRIACMLLVLLVGWMALGAVAHWNYTQELAARV